MITPIALGMPGGAEWIVIAAIGLLLFGKRLPEVGRSLGKGIVEFKKGLKGVEEEIDTASNPQPAQPAQQQQSQITAQAQPTQALPSQSTSTPQFKFDPYTGKPVDTTTTTSSHT
jgi:sec-independent protein translocase protein TatA